MPLKNKLGRKPRAFDLKIPHFSTVRHMTALPILKNVQNNAAGLPNNLGVMLNDRLGDCTCAGMGHATQVASFGGTGHMVTPNDHDVLAAYEAFGFNPQAGPPGQNPTDQGAVLQEVLPWWVKTGISLPHGGTHKLLGYVEIDPRYPDDVAMAIQEAGYVYIGFNVPSDITEDVTPGQLTIWDSFSGGIEGGHCVVLPGFTYEALPRGEALFNVISWGSKEYAMTANFMATYVDEIYMPIDPMWISKSGKSPLGLTEAQIEQIAQTLG